MTQEPWPRDPRLPYPLVYKVVEGKKPMEEHGGRKPFFTIMDVPEDRFQDVVDFMRGEFLDEEISTSFVKLKQDSVSLGEVRHIWLEMLHQKSCLVAFADVLNENGKPRIAGVNMLKVKQINDTFDYNILNGEPLKIVFRYFEELMENCDPFKKYNVDKYLTALGLSVARRYYGQGLGRELLLAREPLCERALNCPLATTVFTATNAQEIAAGIDYHLLAELDYDQFIDKDGSCPYKGVTKAKSSKYMAKKIF